MMFHGKKKPMRADNNFLSNFKPNFLEEVKRMRCGFVDIRVGDFKVSHLQENPNLHVLGSLKCILCSLMVKSLCFKVVGHLYALGFAEEAIMVDKYGKSELVEGTVDAIGKVGQFAQSKLPDWITRKLSRTPWEVLLHEQMQGTILFGVLNESNGNASHAVAIHSGYVYNANEVVAIPLCKQSLDYCCSTLTAKNEFVSF